ncbi:hypothetical protein NORO109296_08015 [Nocardiopsis rhodophaea]
MRRVPVRTAWPAGPLLPYRRSEAASRDGRSASEAAPYGHGGAGRGRTVRLSDDAGCQTRAARHRDDRSGRNHAELLCSEGWALRGAG